MIHLIARLTVASGNRDTVLAALIDAAPLVRAQPECIEYVPVIDAPDGGRMQSPLGNDTLMVIEKWETMDAIYSHASGPHMEAYRARAGHLVIERAVHILAEP